MISDSLTSDTDSFSGSKRMSGVYSSVFHVIVRSEDGRRFALANFIDVVTLTIDEELTSAFTPSILGSVFAWKNGSLILFFILFGKSQVFSRKLILPLKETRRQGSCGL
jgi:hypothetical protein